ncbi:HAD hydrolase-like protein [Phreatobacter cathodiphilus]|uniref:HAD family hydrolase n=1 Tax=Phreatobacter cathodiphilus TaxID=1868589 RepID=A0A2S0NH56_9HYPH|nr:HAD hydrolase-like protein [Phreatobacter cathodiphilus]AVO47492.1 HAD family hydrolase [Phreatobacter cathodiphilus]
MTGYRLAIFDFDGTLADSADWVFGIMNDVARRYGFREIDAAEREALRGRPNREVIRALGVPVWKLPQIAAHMRSLVREKADDIPLFPWTPGLLAELADAGVKVAVASSNDRDTILSILGPETAVHVSAVEGGAALFGKAAKFRRLMRQFGVSPAETVCIGDEHRDVEAAQQAGAASIAVTWGFATLPALAAARPTALAADAAELARLILSGRS